MTEVLKAVSTFFGYAVMAVFAQNAVCARALGVSRLVQMAGDVSVDARRFGTLLCALQCISALLGYFVNRLLTGWTLWVYFRPLGMVLCSTAAFFVVLFIVVLSHTNDAKEIVAVLPMATFNTCVLGTLLISTIQSFSLGQTLGFALGSGCGYVMAVHVVRMWRTHAHDESVPATFRGMPITLLYIGILALAIYGFTGHMLAF